MKLAECMYRLLSPATPRPSHMSHSDFQDNIPFQSMHLRNNIYPVSLRIQFVAVIQPLTGWSSGFDFRNIIFVNTGDKGFVQGRHRYFQAIHAGNLKP